LFFRFLYTPEGIAKKGKGAQLLLQSMVHKIYRLFTNG